MPNHSEHVEVRLIDREGENANLDFVLLDTVRDVERLRQDGRTVLTMQGWGMMRRRHAAKPDSAGDRSPA